MKKITKSSILDLTDGGILYYYKVFPELKNAELKNGRYRNIRNHLRGEKKASLSCYNREGNWRLYDHADPDFSGDVFTIYSKVTGVENFKDILKGIYKEMTGKEPSDVESEGDSVKMEKATLPEGVEYEIEVKDFDKLSDKEQEFMLMHGITQGIMEKYNAMFLSSYTFIANSGQGYKIFSSKEDIIIGYKFADSIKVYKPFAKEYKFMWLGEKPRDYVFGLPLVKAIYNQLKGESGIINNEKIQIVLGAGEKDTMVLNGLDLPAVCLNSETSIYFPEMLYLYLLDICDLTKSDIEVVIVFDNDKTGTKQANLIKEKQGKYDYDIRIVELPEKLKDAGGKDVSDWIHLV